MGQFTGFSQRKKDALKEKVTDTFPSENGKQYKYPRPLMHLRLSICFYSDESKALENCQKRKTSCGSLQGSDSCRISITSLANADGELPQAAVILQDVLERLLNEIPQISDE